MNKYLDDRKSRVYLRPLKQSDRSFFYSVLSDIEYQRLNLVERVPYTEKQIEALFDRIIDRSIDNPPDYIVFIVMLKKPKNKDIMIGQNVLHRIDFINRNAYTGSFIKKSYRSKGLGTEAKKLLLNYAFNELNFHKVESESLSSNKASILHNIKCGFEECGVFHQKEYFDGNYHDVTLLECFKENFLKKRPP